MAETQSMQAQSFVRYPIFGKHACRQRLSIDWCMPSEIEAISPFVDCLMRLVKESQCVPGEEPGVELALREALGNAVLHGNRQDPRKKVHIHCRCRWRGALFVSVRDEGNGFDWKRAEGISAANTHSEHGRGIQLMKAYMDGVRYSLGGSEVQMHKRARSVRILGRQRIPLLKAQRR
jgi:serine/threonine-protein kinase RsbW